jgi:hypothetical protein
MFEWYDRFLDYVRNMRNQHVAILLESVMSSSLRFPSANFDMYLRRNGSPSHPFPNWFFLVWLDFVMHEQMCKHDLEFVCDKEATRTDTKLVKALECLHLETHQACLPCPKA